MGSTYTRPPAMENPQVIGTQDTGHLRRQELNYWYLLGAVNIVTTAGLAFAITPLLGDRVSGLWPWANTHVVLLTLLPLSMALLVGYLTIQKTKARDIRVRVMGLMEDSARRERQNAARLRALLNVSRMMGSVTNLENVFDTITNTCLEVFDCHQASLMLVNTDTNQLETRAATGHNNAEEVKKSTVKIGEGVAGWVAAERKPIILTHETTLGEYPNLKLADKRLAAAMVVPILLRDELVGVLNISNRSPEATYSNEDLQALSVFAESAGTCIRHTEHVEWMRKMIQEQSSRSGRQHHPQNTEALTQE